MRLATFLLAMALPVFAQVEQGIILGTVIDSSGARIANAEVTFTSLATNITQKVRTNATGDFRSIPLRTGPYAVSVEVQGFKTARRTGVTLQVQDELRIDFTMEVGQTSDQVTVTADATLLQTTEASRGQVIENRKIVDLPLNGRDYLQLALLTAGTNVPPPGARFGGFSSSGFRVSHNNYLLDGMDNNSNQHAAQGRTPQVISPSVDAVQEFKVQTSNYSAEFGRNLGGAVNVVIKSGGNEFHGGVFEFIRNEDFNARNFFQRPGVPNAVFRRNQFGGLIGGPIIRNKTFFFVNYEGTLERTADTALSTVATAQERRGDFSRAFFNNVPTQIFDPATYNSTTRARQPFAGNVIPTSRLDPVAVRIAGFAPDPNQGGLINNYFSNPKTTADTHKGDVRIDHNISAKDTVYGRFSYQNFFQIGSSNLPPPAFGGGDPVSNENRPQSFVISHGHVFSPTLYNTLKVGWNRLLTRRASPVDRPLNQEIGLKGTAQNINGFGLFNINGFASLGPPANNPQFSDSQTRQFSNDLLWTRGRHTIKTGVNLMFIQSPHEQAFQSNGTFTFNGNFTRQSSNNTFGNPYADFLLGIPFNSQLSTYAQGNQRRRIHAGYVQDDFKVSQRLTLNLGMRWEYIGPWFEKYNRYANFDIDESYSNPRLRIARDGNIAERSTVSADYNNWGPRAGFAYRLDNKTVIRSGYGIYYGGVDHIGDRYLHCGPPFFYQFGFNTDSINPTILLRDGFPAGATTSNVTNLQTISQDRTNRSPYSQQWNFTVQRELAADWSLEAGYVGTKGNRLLQRYDSNAPDPGPGNINTRRPVTRLEVPGIGIVTPLADTFRREFSANSNYHAVQLRAEKRMSGGFSTLGSYVFSKTISDARGGADAGGTAANAVQNRNDFRAERSLADEHFAHRFVLSANWDVPVGRGRRFMTGMPRWSDAVIGGWALGGISTMTSGRRVNVSVNGDPANVGGGAAPRPNTTGASPILPADQRALTRWFNTDAFTRQPAFTFGNSPRNPVSAPSLKNLDLAIYKAFQFSESRSLQVRGEFFNATNTPFFGAPGGTLGVAQFGVINDAAPARIIQIAAKFYF
ncbi:MAG: carboxypeptidase regulatory-like domain-containing protein [Bryobacterales bacterium]|nr:carboxypeptidase regulatory-like domain-containing protein [Bryobacterales bacterium]